MRKTELGRHCHTVPYNTLEHWDHASHDVNYWRSHKGQLGNKLEKIIVPRLKNGAKRGVQRLLGSVSKFLPEPCKYPDVHDIKQIVLFGDMGIGNFIMFTPLLRALRSKFSRAEIVVVFIKGRGADLVAERLETIDRIVHIPQIRAGNVFDSRAFLKAAKQHKLAPELVVGRFNGSPFIPMFAVASRAKWRVGHTSSAGFVGFCDAVYNYPVPMAAEDHEVERNLNLARALGVDVSGCQLEFGLTENDTSEMNSVIQRLGVPFEKLICLQMGSSEIQKWKRWPEESWVTLIRKLAEENWELGLIGSTDEAEMVQRIAHLSGVQCFNLCGQLSLGGTGALLRSSRLLVCNDSGLMHIAAAVGLPIIGLFGPTEYERTKPWTSSFVGLRGECHCNGGSLFDRQTLKKIEACERPCLSATTAEDVFTEVKKILGP